MDHMIQHRLKSFINKRHCTLLGVGPMSVNCVDATIDLANDYEIPILMIASRRQIDSEEFGRCFTYEDGPAIRTPQIQRPLGGGMSICCLESAS
jgi:hypothetical protein